MADAEKTGTTNSSILRHSAAVVVLGLGLLVGMGGWAAFAKLAFQGIDQRAASRLQQDRRAADRR